MSSYELADRMGLSPSRVRKLEAEEISHSIRLSMLARAAEALNCQLLYLFAPNDSIEQTVLRQAYYKAAELLGITDVEALYDKEEDLAALDVVEQLEGLTMQLVDRRGLWSIPEAEPERQADSGAFTY